MPAYGTVADNIAARYTAAVTPSGARAIASATAALPNNISETPTVLVFPEPATLTPGNGTRMGRMEWLARLYYDQAANGVLELQTRELLDWAATLADIHGTDLDLGGTVVACRTIGWRMGVLRYGGAAFTGLEMRLETITSEPWLPTA